MWIKLPFDLVKEDVRDCTTINDTFTYDNEEYLLVDITKKYREDHFKWETKIFKRLSDEKHFSIQLTTTINSPDDLEFEEEENECELWETWKQEIISYEWV